MLRAEMALSRVKLDVIRICLDFLKAQCGEILTCGRSHEAENVCNKRQMIFVHE